MYRCHRSQNHSAVFCCHALFFAEKKGFVEAKSGSITMQHPVLRGAKT